MKIKSIGIKKKPAGKGYYSWMVEEKPKTKGRLGQLNKHNRVKKKSEFLDMAEAIESAPSRKLFVA